MLTSSRSRVSSWIGCFIFSLLTLPIAATSQSGSCPTVNDHPITPADQAYADARYADAETLYAQSIAQQTQDASISESLVRTLLHEGKTAQASAQANRGTAANPHAPAALTAVAEVQLRQGQPWAAMQTLDAVVAADPCYARAHLIRSRVFRINSLYASERAEIQKAYEIDSKDPDIQQAWFGVVSPAHEIESIDSSLKSMKGLDVETQKKAAESIHSMLPLLRESSQTCQVLPAVDPATLPIILPLQPTYADVKHIDGYQLEAQLPQKKARLLVDTAASGLYISRALAEANGFPPDTNLPGTVHADSVRIGPLQFRDCTVGVSDTPFPGNADGYIGTDIFAPWLITLDFHVAKLVIGPLTAQAGVLPGDRPDPSVIADFIPAYHRRQYLLLPVTFNNQSQQLFVLASGMRYSAMTSEAAHSVSKMTINFTNSEQTVSGGKVQFFRDTFQMQFANLPQIHQAHILQLDPSTINQNAGFQIAGMLGLDILSSMILHLDYRDGLVKIEPFQQAGPASYAKSGNPAPVAESAKSACPSIADRDLPLNRTVEAQVTGTVDSGHLKAGKEIWLKAMHGWSVPGCTIDAGATLYARIISASSSKNPTASELSLVVDQADCTGHDKQELPLRLIGLIAPPGETRRMHDQIPAEVRGGARSISDAQAGTDLALDENLNPSGPPQTVHPGIVIRMPNASLEPQGGAGCSARIRSTDRSIQLGTGTELIFAAAPKSE